MKKLKVIILTTWFILAVILMCIEPFIFNIIDLTLLVLNVMMPFVLLISDIEIRDMDIF